jgi:DNA gyrase/topoisomerase IV subunit B
MGSENVHRYIQNSENCFLERYHKDGDEFLNHIVTGDETRVSFLNVEAKGQSKQWMHTQSSNKPKKFKQTSACQEADGNCFLVQEESAGSGIHATGDRNSIRSVLQNTKKLHRAI